MPRSSPNVLRPQFPIQWCPSTEIGMGLLSRLSALFWRSATPVVRNHSSDGVEMVPMSPGRDPHDPSQETRFCRDG
ncbi:MAG: hypothetical protein OJF50_006670 [Nitrospira sp.]|nr:hypothetical protein [Nitrospira sp.]